MAQWLKSMPHKHRAWDVIPRTHAKMSGMGINAYNASTGEVETGRFLELTGQPVEFY